MRLAAALDVPLRQHNSLLISAGFAPVWRQTDLAAPELGELSRALDYMLAQQEPFPAVAIDRYWNLLRSNSGAVRLVEFLVGPLAPDTPVNLADAVVAADVLRSHLLNWMDNGSVLRPERGSRRRGGWHAGDGGTSRKTARHCSPIKGREKPSTPRQPKRQ
jgi:hypothetical protein